ncbi:DNA (cytosine-5)-methyltransferase 1 [Lentzea atacamensis]|uniref:DNA (cytosine-5-)-methyltransferase n=1 Tax=Lentzea atacamensis TaxID=531938 RepID=A0A316HHI7_9PSEU|nr:DNA cytosine methyltransferase [Lentzea atacamensis]PWK80644.1 DNA (cytosine-5)-methyltransferase 1 [Lentzea atacamensis]
MSAGPVLGSLCTGYGGLDLGVLAALGGGRIAWCADSDPHVAQILASRMPEVPNLGDLRTIEWTQVEPIDVLVAGFPCQDISAAGKRIGIEKGERSGLWTDIVAGVRVLRPALFVVENVAALRWRNGGLHRVLGDLAEAGYDAFWRSVRACDIGAPHRRERVFLLAWPRTGTDAHAADTASARRRQPRSSRPGASSTTRSPGQPARRGEQRHQAAAHADGVGCEGVHSRESEGRPVAVRRVPDASDHGVPERFYEPVGVPANASCDRRNERLSGTTRIAGGPHVALGDHLVAVTRQDGERRVGASVDWGAYTPAVRRWEQLLGRPTPYPTQLGQHGRPVLAPAFVEHLMGLPAGWVTDVQLPRTAQLRALGNGVVPQQATLAISLLLNDLIALLSFEHAYIREAAA